MNHNGFLAWYSLTSIWVSGAALCSTNRAIPNTRYRVRGEIELDQWQFISSIMWRLTILSQNQSKYSDTNGARHYIIISSGQGTNFSRGRGDDSNTSNIILSYREDKTENITPQVHPSSIHLRAVQHAKRDNFVSIRIVTWLDVLSNWVVLFLGWATGGVAGGGITVFCKHKQVNNRGMTDDHYKMYL